MNIQTAKNKFTPMSETMLYILMSLIEERHGYGIMQHVKEITNGRIVLGAGTIYQTLMKLEKGELIKSTKEMDRKKFYIVTEIGKQILLEEKMRITEIAKNMEGLI
jgi:DNA-binding PadR family transcriptional regulator